MGCTPNTPGRRTNATMAWNRTGVQIAGSDVISVGLSAHVSLVVSQQPHCQQPIPLGVGDLLDVHAQKCETNTAVTRSFDQSFVGNT